MNIGDIHAQASGNLTADPEIRFTPAGAPVAKFRMACTPRKFNSTTSKWEDGQTTFIGVEGWRGLAENVVETLKKGTTVVVMGNMRVRDYEDRDGNKRQATEIYDALIAVDLTFQIAEVSRASSNSTSGTRQPAAAQAQAPRPAAPAAPAAPGAAPAAGGGLLDEPPF